MAPALILLFLPPKCPSSSHPRSSFYCLLFVTILTKASLISRTSRVIVYPALVLDSSISSFVHTPTPSLVALSTPRSQKHFGLLWQLKTSFANASIPAASPHHCLDTRSDPSIASHRKSLSRRRLEFLIRRRVYDLPIQIPLVHRRKHSRRRRHYGHICATGLGTATHDTSYTLCRLFG